MWTFYYKEHLTYYQGDAGMQLRQLNVLNQVPRALTRQSDGTIRVHSLGLKFQSVKISISINFCSQITLDAFY